MKITLCGSIAFMSEMKSESSALKKIGHEVKMPSTNLRDMQGNQYPTSEFRKEKKMAGEDDKHIWDVIHLAITDHFNKVAWSDAILVCNYDKHKVKNYVGPNTLMEMGLALHLKKKIFLLNPIPNVDWKEEILGIQPIELSGKLELIG